RVEKKTGRSGPFTLVNVVHALSVASKLALTEEQDIVYRPAANDLAATPTAGEVNDGRDPSEKPAWIRTVAPHPALLCCCSARTRRPLCVDQDISMHGRLGESAAELWACGPNGHRAYEVNVSVGQ